MSVLVDSDVVIEITRGRDSGILSRWRELCAADKAVLCSPVTVAEVWRGARPSEHPLLIALFSTLVCIPIDAEMGRVAGEYLQRYHRGHHIELGDALIRATAVTQNAVLWTRNRKHYPMKELTLY